MTDIIYLAAGNSSRFPSNKLLADFGGKELYRHGLDKIIALSEKRKDINIILVSQYDEIISEYKDILTAVKSPMSKEGLSRSIKSGLEYAKGSAAVFAAADQPFIREETLIRLIDSYDENTEISRVYYEDIPGNPVLFSSALFPELMLLTGDEGGRSIIKKHKVKKVYAVSPEELCDIDTAEDMKKENKYEKH